MMQEISNHDLGAQVYGDYDGDIFVVEDLRELPQQSEAVKLQFNTFFICSQGRVQAEIGDATVMLNAGQMLVLPSNKTARSIMVSPNVSASVLAISDRMLKTLLSSQIGIWNRAMYLQKTHVIEADWCNGLKFYIPALLKDEDLRLKKEISLSFLRTFMLLICAQFAKEGDGCRVMGGDDFPADHQHPTATTHHPTATTHHPTVMRDDVLFNRFLDLLAGRAVKRMPVSYYASKLCITPKHLSSVCSRASGKAPSLWIAEYVVEDITTALRYSDKSLKEIAREQGFPNTSFFSKFFRAQTGMTPTEYRRRALTSD